MAISLNGTTGAITGVGSINSTVDSTEIGYLDGITSAVQTQINSKPTGGTGSWTAFSPTLSSSTGTITTSSATGAYTQIGKLVVVRYNCTITTNGTGNGYLSLTLPVNRIGVINGFGRENSMTGKMLNVVDATGQTIAVFYYDNTYPGVSGGSYTIHIMYEAA